MRMMRATGVNLLIIDEVHNLLAGAQVQQRRMLNLLRWLGNELQIPLVAVGTAEALHAIQSDDQLANRFEPVGLPPWREGEEYRQLLSTLEAVYDVQRRDVIRRFKRGWESFESIYRPMADSWAIYDNSGASPVLLEKHG